MCEWKQIPFGECFELHRNNTCARAFMGNAGSIQNIHYGDILVKYGAVVDLGKEEVPYLTEDGEKCAPKDYLKDGDIVIADTAEDEIAGKVVEVRGLGDRKATAGLHTVMCRPKDGEMFEPGWLGYWMNSKGYHDQLISMMTGIKVLSLSRANFAKTYICVPKREEQRRIVSAFNDADRLIANLEKRIAKRKLIKQGMMQQLLTGAVRLPGFTGEWKEHRLTDVADFVTGTVSTDAIRKDEYVGTENMKPNCMGVDKNLADVPYASVREYRIGDVLLSNIRPYLKKCWLSTRNGGCSNDVIVVRGYSDMVMPEFLYSVLSQDAFFKYVMNAVVGTKMPRGDKKVIAQYGLRLPPKLAEQQAIAAVLTDMDSEITVLEKKVKKYRQLKSGMMSELLTGKVRLAEGK